MLVTDGIGKSCVAPEPLLIMALRKAMFSWILFAVAPSGVFAQTAAIHVRVLDGRTGKTLSGMNIEFVDYHTDSDGKPNADLNGRMIVRASADGDSYIANPDAHGILVFNGLGNGVWTPCTRQKLYDSHTRTLGNERLYPVSTIVASGLVTKIIAAEEPLRQSPMNSLFLFAPQAGGKNLFGVWRNKTGTTNTVDEVEMRAP
jgi:hypothetical protein